MHKTSHNKLSFKQKLELELFRNYKHHQAVLHPLKYLQWEMTLRCNLNCLHCGSDCSVSSEFKDMPLADFLPVLDEIKRNTDSRKVLIGLTGGEPMMRKDIYECGQEFIRKEFPWGMVSNGYFLTEHNIQKLLDAGLHSITISLDGTEKIHNWFRNRNHSFAHAYKAIQMLAKIPQIKFDVVSAVHSRNINELSQFKSLLVEAGLREWRLFTIFPSGRAIQYPELQLNNKQFVQLMDFIKQTRLEGDINASYGCEGFLGDYENQVRDHYYYCISGIYSASVLVNGDITGCTSMRDKFVVGNIYKDGFWDKWENGFDLFRKREWTKQGQCADCSFYRFCEGNGLHLWDTDKNQTAMCHLKRLEI